MRRKLIKDISANTVQTLVTQIFGILIFYITSKYLIKSDFGEFNWSMALGSTIIGISTLGLDLVFVKRIAAGANVLTTSGIHFFHTLVSFVVLCTLAALLSFLIPAFTLNHPLFLFAFINLALANVANSFKLGLNGLESYKSLAVLALCSNVLKFLLILFFYFSQKFTINNVIFSYTAATALELVMGYILMTKVTNHGIKPVFHKTEYKGFIHESLPQLGIVFFDSALARIDWILLGIISTAAITAEYTFAYKIFELSKLPVLIIAPVLLTRFTKLFNNNNRLNDRQSDEIQLFLKVELFIVMLIPIVLVCTWTPLIDYFTNNKYGSINEVNFMLLAACVPLSCIINFLWTVGFVQGQLKTIMFITILVSILNVASNAALIPFFNGLGAAISFLFCTLVQLVLYIRHIRKDQIKLNIRNCIISCLNALGAIVIGKFSANNIIFTTIIAIFVFTALTFITAQLNLKQLKQLMTKQP